MQSERKADAEAQDNNVTKSKNKQGGEMRNERQEITHRGRRRATLETEWWRRFGALCLQLCLILAVTASAQNEQDPNKKVKFTTLVNFDGTNGGNQGAGLVQGTDGNLYGTANVGGANGAGTVFKVSPDGTLTTLYNFCSQPNCADGGSPSDVLVLGTDGNLYGVTQGGGHGAGTFFKITPSGTLTTLYNWCSQLNCTDGSYGFFPEPNTLVLATDGNFYGTNNFGGNAFGAGTVFKITPGGTLTTLYTFCSQPNCTDGANPAGSLLQASDGNFYGTTSSFGNAFGAGTVFKITAGGTLTTLYTFCSQPNCTDGGFPFAPLIQATDGNLYGTTGFGGANVNSGNCGGPINCYGTVFKITPSGTLTTLYSFCPQTNCLDGSSPNFALVQATDGNFYGTTVAGGGSGACGVFAQTGCGVVFKITPKGTLTTLQSFDRTNGMMPAGLVQATNGSIYGTNTGGGNRNPVGGPCFRDCGTVFSLDVGLGPFVETVPTAGTVGEAVTILGNDLADATHVFFNHTQAAFTVLSNSEY
jgi:uncharacterized repeat protein (TIGR03803 family)